MVECDCLVAGEWGIEPAARKVVQSLGWERNTGELEARSSEKFSKKTLGKGEEHPHRRMALAIHWTAYTFAFTKSWTRVVRKWRVTDKSCP